MYLSDTFKFHDMINDYLGQEAGDIESLILSIMKILPKIVNDRTVAQILDACEAEHQHLVF